MEKSLLGKNQQRANTFSDFVNQNVNKYQSDKIVSTNKMPWILWLYIFIDFVFSFIVTLIFFIIIFIINQVLLLAKNILQINIPIWEVLKLLVYYLPNALLISIPFATLVSCLMSVGGFSSQNEFVAMRGAGISFARTLYPYIAFSICIMGFSFFANEVLVPLGSINFSRQYQRILTLNPQLSLQDNSITQYKDDIIVTKSITEDGIDGVVIMDNDSDGNQRTITARKARIKNSKKGVISLQLDDVVSIGAENKRNEYNYAIAKQMTYSILLTDLTLDVQNVTSELKTILDLHSEISENYKSEVLPVMLDKVDAAQNIRYDLIDRYNTLTQDYLLNNKQQSIRSDYQLENYARSFITTASEVIPDRNDHINRIIFFKKIAFPGSVLLFILVAFPMGLFYKRSGKTVGFGIGLLLSFVYWLAIIICQSVAFSNLNLSPFLVMWIPNFLVFILGITLIVVRRKIS